ncbi:MAG: beta-ketoacyl-ACP synthase [Nitratireductor sp.]
MTDTNREVWITGIGLVSSQGEGIEQHMQALSATPKANQDSETFAPYTVHPLPEMDWKLQIPRKESRQMETWQRLGTYAAGLALEDAGMKENEDIVSSMDLVVCAGGGERDIDVDNAIMKESRERNDHGNLLNERLQTELRPTLFLAQLSNLMAGNISIVHKVTGSSRTYMGEESAGITAIQNAVSRISAGQSTHLLVGGAYNAERLDLLLSVQLGDYLLQDSAAPISERIKSEGGTLLGSAGVFLVLEEAEFAKTRGAKPYAKLTGVASDLGAREEAQTKARLNGILDDLNAAQSDDLAIMSGATGCKEITTSEFDVLRERLGSQTAIRAYTNMIGNPLEANFPFGIALSALALKNETFYPKFEASEIEANATPSKILVTSLGHFRGEGMAMVEKV